MWEKRVSEAHVGRILNVIASPPNLREYRLAGDLEGDFDKWFDGGAIRMHTGHTDYHFADGTKASVGVLAWLSVVIRFPDGTTVTIKQES